MKLTSQSAALGAIVVMGVQLLPLFGVPMSMPQQAGIAAFLTAVVSYVMQLSFHVNPDGTPASEAYKAKDDKAS